MRPQTAPRPRSPPALLFGPLLSSKKPTLAQAALKNTRLSELDPRHITSHHQMILIERSSRTLNTIIARSSGTP